MQQIAISSARTNYCSVYLVDTKQRTVAQSIIPKAITKNIPKYLDMHSYHPMAVQRRSRCQLISANQALSMHNLMFSH